MNGKILYRDISKNNIIVTDPKEAGGFVNILIDLDLTKELSSGLSGARYRTGII
jgi:Fungal protein kinase